MIVDNVATPIAAMLGDVVTLVILGGLASLFAKFMGKTLLFPSLSLFPNSSLTSLQTHRNDHFDTSVHSLTGGSRFQSSLHFPECLRPRIALSRLGTPLLSNGNLFVRSLLSALL